MKNSKKMLDRIVQNLLPLLNKWNFKYIPGDNSFSSGGEFSSCFFENEKIKIGLICRGNSFGSVNYETNYSNISHNMLIRYLNKENEQQLYYNNKKSIETALFEDLENIVMPYIMNTDIVEINKMIKNERKKIGL
jgi:hypothetical protein